MNSEISAVVVGRFFKVLMPGRFETSLKLPPAFTKKLNMDDMNSPKVALLTSCKGSWNISVKKCSQQICLFGESWKRYVLDHELKIGDFIVFEHTGRFHFTTFVFDNETYCHKDYFVASDEDNGDEEEDDVQVINDGQEKAHSGSSKDMNTQFRTRLSKFHFSGCLNIPKAFAISNRLNTNRAVTLRNAATGDSCVACISVGNEAKRSPSYFRFRLKSLREFLKINKLKVGDECIFKLQQHDSKHQKNVLMDVHFKRA